MLTRDFTRKTSKRLVETISFQIATSCVDHAALVEKMVMDYNNATWCELPIIVSALRALSFTHQINHWVASGDPFYGDHLLFERLYNQSSGEIDTVAEKSVGLGGSSIMNPSHQVAHEALLMQILCPSNSTLPNSEELARRSYEAEMHFMGILDILTKKMEMEGNWSIGVENMLGQIADTHESHVYLLKQRVVG